MRTLLSKPDGVAAGTMVLDSYPADVGTVEQIHTIDDDMIHAFGGRA